MRSQRLTASQYRASDALVSEAQQLSGDIRFVRMLTVLDTELRDMITADKEATLSDRAIRQTAAEGFLRAMRLMESLRDPNRIVELPEPDYGASEMLKDLNPEEQEP